MSRQSRMQRAIGTRPQSLVRSRIPLLRKRFDDLDQIVGRFPIQQVSSVGNGDQARPEYACSKAARVMGWGRAIGGADHDHRRHRDLTQTWVPVFPRESPDNR